MKNKIIIFLVGLLLGAIISTGSIYVYTVANNSNNNKMDMQMFDVNGTRGDMMDNDTAIPEKPNSVPDGNQKNNQDIKMR